MSDRRNTRPPHTMRDMLVGLAATTPALSPTGEVAANHQEKFGTDLLVTEIGPFTAGREVMPAKARQTGFRLRQNIPAIRAVTRRDVMRIGASAFAMLAVPSRSFSQTETQQEYTNMGYVTTADGTEIFFKDWGPRDAQALVFHHGWPLSSDDWDTQMMFFLEKGFRVIAHDRRGHGRSTQTDTGNEMDTYAADVDALTDALDLKGAIHIGHSTGGGEVARYVARAKPGRVAKAVLIGAITPLMLKTSANPDGLPIEAFDALRAAHLANRAQFFLDVPSGPFYSFNRPGAVTLPGVIQNWWRQGMMGGTKSHYDCIKTFSETDFTEDLKAIEVPVLVMHGDDDQMVPLTASAPRAAALLKHSTLKIYKGFPHGMCTTHADVINADLLAFVQS